MRMPVQSDVKQDLEKPENIAQAFVVFLREMGVNVPISSAIVFYQALAHINISKRNDVYWAGRSTLVTNPNDFLTYDEAFHAFWEDFITLNGIDLETATEIVTSFGEESDESGSLDEETEEGTVIPLRYSRSEILRKKDFAEYTEKELDEAYKLMQSVRLLGSTQKSRRMNVVSSPNRTPDIKSMIRASFRTDTEPIQRYFQQKDQKIRKLVFLLDVSGSMETYSRALLRFIQASVVGRRKVEAFTIGTRLTRVTKELSNRDLDEALNLTSESISDWSGGTRIGETLENFLNHWGQRGMARGATIIILSDGWDRGKSDVMAEQMGRLKRISHKIIWMNPLKVSPGYEPLAQGIATALPYIDDFIEGHSLESLIELAEILTE